MKRELVIGVYGIRNITNGKVYIGSAALSVEARWNHHRCLLRKGSHYNAVLQRAWNKYGEYNFEFFVVEYCSAINCVSREQKWIDHYLSYDRSFGYNISPTAGSSLGVKHSVEARIKMSAAKKGRPGHKHSEETKARIAAANTGHGATVEVRAKLRAAQLGKTASKETRAKMSATRRGKKRSPETVAKTAAAHTGMKRSAETCARISAALKGYVHTDETRAKMSDGQKRKAIVRKTINDLERSKSQ